ncbi:acyltransferase family protein [Fibrella aquatica]|jgi:predicted acyltransferase|uniref:acyltransferase family protein n=1 Tax=Fibrella aquatica TaxID=3242487 RepID=UPI00351FE85E
MEDYTIAPPRQAVLETDKRFLSLDVFRGLTVCFMIVVNTPGAGSSSFSPLNHAEWHGFTPTDLVFPSFLFAVGNAMSFAMTKINALPTSAVLGKVAKRTAIIFLLGYLMYWFPFFKLNDTGDISSFPIGETRIWGVLQRIGVCYGIASLMVYFFSTRTVFWVSVAFLVGYWLMLLGWGDSTDPLGLMGNAVRKLDRFLVGDAHLYHGNGGVAFDPEGLLSTLPAIVNVIIGYYAGTFVQRIGKNYESVAKLLLAGALLIFAALCWDMVFPINKKLWTSSFVLITTGLDLVLLSTLIYALEIRNWNKANWAEFFVIPGKNPLFIYLLSEVLVIVFYMVPAGNGESVLSWIGVHIFQSLAPGPLGSLLFALAFMLLCWSVGWALDRRKIYIRV